MKLRVLQPLRRVPAPGTRRLAAALIIGLAVAGCAGNAPSTTFDLSAPQQKVRGGSVRGQVSVSEPISIQTLEGQSIIVKDAAGSVSFLGGGQWADRLPRLIQARLVETFENASRLRAVSRTGDNITADYQLISELRAFQIDAATRQAVVEMSVKLVSVKTGSIVQAKVFASRVPVPGDINAGSAAQTLDQALSVVLLDIVRWIGTGHN